MQCGCGFLFACVKAVHSIMSVDNLTIGSNDSPIEKVLSDEETQLLTMEANQRPKMVPEKGSGAEADIGQKEDQDEVKHAKQSIINILDNLNIAEHAKQDIIDILDTSIAEQEQPSAIEPFLLEAVSTYHKRHDIDNQKKRV